MAKMNILAINSGSSSIKCSLFCLSERPEEYTPPIWEEKIEWKNAPATHREELESAFRSHFKHLKVDLIGHRIVHGGSKYRSSAPIDREVKEHIRQMADLAPLHNRLDLMGIESLEKIFPAKPQIAVFDTSFHRTMPMEAIVYPGPYSWLQQGIQRYGFHGTSFQYCTRRAAQMLGSLPSKMVLCHLGSGASLCAVKEGQSIDTTMGFTPLEGLMMDTRSGTIDPGILLHLLKKKTAEELTKELYERSGLLGLSGISSDMRDILEHAAAQNERANIALNVYLHRLTSSIGSMIASLGGIDTLVFTGGIGENSPLIRERVCARLECFGIQLAAKSANDGDADLSAPDSKAKILLIHTQEAFEIARECWNYSGIK